MRQCMFDVEINEDGSKDSCMTIYTVMAPDAEMAARRAKTLLKRDGFKGGFAASVTLLGVEGGR
jgi:hypothetical protein